MKRLSLLAGILISTTAYTQVTRIDYAKNESSSDKKEIMEAWQQKMSKSLEMMPAMVLDHL